MDKTLLKGLQVLEYVVSQPESARSSQVAVDLGLMKSNAHRVLKTLEHAGYLHQDPQTREFRTTLKLWEMGSQIIDRLDLRKCASTYLQELANETGEAVHLSVLDGSEVIYIDKIDSPQPVGAYTRTGGRAPAYCVATGKALLAELRETRVRGYSINRGEWRESVWGLAATIRDSRNNPIAAVGVSGPDFRLSDPERNAQMGAIVTAYATRISRALGSRG